MARRDHEQPWFSVTLDDCELKTMQSGGPGGQHQNKTETGVRIRHEPSGAEGVAREHRSQLQNKKAAWKRMVATPQFKVWLAREIHRRRGIPSAEERVAKDMQPDNLKVEVKRDGRWAVEDEQPCVRGDN